ncbi:hypothetical protein JTB14_031472 [Gonioctena quinquepunctata]|nr:hypothetical protein JTB14_031472 [Gonioctena quinquepunctata]
MTCNIVLENIRGTYCPGDAITGHVECTFPTTEDILGISIKLRGNEHTSWSERKKFYDPGRNTLYRNVCYSGNNEVLFRDLTLIREGSIASGRYEYPFSFILPKSLPSTFEGSYGYIKYYIKASVVRRFGPDRENERNINMHSLIDFNEIRADLQLEPATYQEEKTLCFFCCVGGPITVDVNLEKEAFVLGEIAKIKIDINNSTNQEIDQISMKLILTTRSKTTSLESNDKYESEVIWSAGNMVPGVGANGSKTYEFDMKIPKTAPLYNFNRSILFNQWTTLKVGAVISGCHSNIEIAPQVMLGHIPIARLQDQQTHHPEPVMYSQSPLNSTTDNAPPYPTRAPRFPVPTATPAPFGFAISPSNGPSPANAPPDESTPSAPSLQQHMTNGRDCLPDGPPTDSQPPLDPAADNVLPYPTGDPTFPVPSKTYVPIEFAISPNTGPSPANPPPVEYTPLAPSLHQHVIDGRDTSELPPPSYDDAMRTPRRVHLLGKISLPK